MDYYIETLLETWQTATPTGYLYAALSIVLLGWMASKWSR